jgi:hypothetical protein
MRKTLGVATVIAVLGGDQNHLPVRFSRRVTSLVTPPLKPKKTPCETG